MSDGEARRMTDQWSDSKSAFWSSQSTPFLELLYDIAVEVRCVQDEQGCRFDQVRGPRRRNARRRVNT
jgi:hypothetical protein